MMGLSGLELHVERRRRGRTMPPVYTAPIDALILRTDKRTRREGGINARNETLHSALRCDRDRPRAFGGTFFHSGSGAGARAQGWVHEESHPRCFARHDGQMGEGA